MGEVTHVIFDMDGLLLDTERYYTVAQDEVFSHFPGCGYQERKEELKSMMMGMKSKDASALVVRELNLADKMSPDEFLERRAKILRDLLPQAELMPGAGRLLEHFIAHKVPCALATSSNRVHFKLKTSRHTDLFNRVFSHMVTGDDVTNGKPHPEIFLKAASLFPDSPAPSATLVFEDSPNGIEAAIAGGFKSIHIPDAHMDKKPSQPPNETLTSLEHFRPEAWGFPPFAKA